MTLRKRSGVASEASRLSSSWFIEVGLEPLIVQTLAVVPGGWSLDLLSGPRVYVLGVSAESKHG